MLDEDEFWRHIQAGNWHEAHELLDAASSDPSPGSTFIVAHLRSATLKREGRFDEAIRVLRGSRSDFPCQTLSHDGAARLLERTGRRDEAIAELRCAPFESEREQFPLLVTDARFFLLYLLAKSGMAGSDPDIHEFPEDYESVVPDPEHVIGEFVTKADLQRLLNQRS